MITSLSWIKNHLSTKASLKQVVERLTEIGLEVEGVKSPDNDLDLKISWPKRRMKISKKDKNLMTLNTFKKTLKGL